MKPYLILILLVVATYANSLQNQFLWDDETLIINNPAIHLSFREMPSVFTDSLWELAGNTESTKSYYRPVLSLFFMLNYKVWGLNPIGFHISNILLHLIITIILYRIGRILFSNENISLIAASMFAVHPINHEPVGRVASGEVIFGFFIILTLYLFLKERRCLALLTFTLTLFTKEPAVMFPFAILILTIKRDGYKKGMLSATPYILLAGVYLIIRWMVMGEVLGGVKVDVPVSTRLFTMITVTMDYIRLLIIPYYISPFYPARWYKSICEPKVIIAIITLISIFTLIFRIRRDGVILFLISSALLMLVPVIWKVNTFPVGSESVYLAERFLYVPLMLFSLFISAFIVRLAGNNKRPLIMGWILFMVVFMASTISSNMIWENNFTLTSRIVIDSPDALWAHNNLGNAYLSYNRFDEAIKEFLIAIRLNPNSVIRLNPSSAIAHNNLGTIYFRQNRFDEAMKEFLIAIRLDPSSAIAHNNLGNIYFRQNRFDEAIKEYLTAIRLKSNFVDPHYNLGLVYMGKGLKDSARKEFEMIIKLNPNHQKAHQAIEELKLKN